MAIDTSGLVIGAADFSGLDRGAQTLERRRAQEQENLQRQESRKNASGTFVKNYLDSKDYLSGTNYDPEIVRRLNEAMTQGAELASKGANTADIMMALGPKVNQISQYSTKAKLIDQQIKANVEKLKAYGGYNQAALLSEAKKMAFQNDDGTLKDIESVDPNMDWIAETVKNKPDLVTTGAGLDDFVKKTPSAKYSRSVQTSYAGRTKTAKYEAEHPFWEDLQRDEKGGFVTDATGNPLGLGVVGSAITGDDGKPIFNKTTNKPYMAMDEGNFKAVMQHNPDVADYVRGQVMRSFKDAGAKKIPEEGSPQWNMKARNILYDELSTRSKSSFRTIEQERQSAPSVKIDIARDPALLDATDKYYDATRKNSGTSNSLKPFQVNPIDAIGRVFANDPEYTGGEQKTVNGRQVIDVTSALPGGGLKKGRGEDEVYKSIYYDPSKRTLIVEQEVKDQFGNPKKSLEEVGEANVGQFMRKIAEANNVPLTAVRSLLDNMGYKDGKFTKVGQGKTLTAPAPPPRDASKMTFKDMKGVEVPDGKIVEATERSGFNPKKWAGDSFYVVVKGEDGKEIKKTFPTREALNEYVNKTKAPAADKPASGGGDWKSRAKKVQ